MVDVRTRRTVIVIATAVLAVGGGAGWYYTFGPCADNLALSTPDARLAFERNTSTGILRVEHVGGDALIDRDDWTSEWCREEWEPDTVTILVSSESMGQVEARYLWLARNGSGVGTLPLAPGDSVTLVEPNATADGDFRLDEPLHEGDVVRVIGRSEESAATFGKYVVGEE